MKTLLTLALVLIAQISFARVGNEGGGGGDPCEDRIKVIRADLRSWIDNKGPEALTLPKGVTTEMYSAKMLTSISEAQIQCVGPQDKGYPVTVEGTPKVCRFDISANRKTITCDYAKFRDLNETEQYILIHHEYAGLSGIEVPNKNDSNYDVSNQISAYLVNQVVKRLAVKKKTELTSDWKMLPTDEMQKIFDLIRYVTLGRSAYYFEFPCIQSPQKVAIGGETPICSGSQKECKNQVIGVIDWFNAWLNRPPPPEPFDPANASDESGFYTRLKDGKRQYMFYSIGKKTRDVFRMIYEISVDGKFVTSLTYYDETSRDWSYGDLNDPDTFKQKTRWIEETNCKIGRQIKPFEK